MIHTCGLGLVAVADQHGMKRKRYAGLLFLGGIVLFCGPLYGIVILNEKKPLSSIAPIGGTMFIIGWIALGFL
jgi:uncharacterized membrane protein YgdD (TMEM256/DUF423 family)